MRRRRLGESGLELPAVCFGAWALGGRSWGGSDDRASVDAVRAGIEAGIDAVDTAPVYGFGRSERAVGDALAGAPRRALVLTKAGLRWDDARGELFFETRGDDGRKVRVFRNARPDSLRFEVEQSLARLRVETLDLLQIHWPDPTTPIADSMGALLELRREGKLREIGVSNYSPAQVEEARAALGDVPLASNQVPYSLLDRSIELGVLPQARALGIGILAYSPLAQGLLTGRVTALRRFPKGDQRRLSREFALPRRLLVNRRLRVSVLPIARSHGVTPAQVVLAWTASQPGVTAVLAGARSPEQARENAVGGTLELSAAELERIDAAFAPARAAV